MSKRTFKMRMWKINLSTGAGAAAFAFVFLYLLSLLPLQFISKGEAATACVLFGSVFGPAFFTVPILLSISGTYVFAKKKRMSDVLSVWGGSILFYVILCSLLVFVPRWSQIVANTRSGYHDYQERHKGENRENSYRRAERYAELTRPIWEWLAK